MERVSGDDRTEGGLAELELEARSISTQRRRLHDRIDFVRGNGMESSDGQLERLLDEERELSQRRRELHARIDELRAGLGMSTGSPPKASRLGG